MGLRNKSIRALLLCSFLILGLVACGKSENAKEHVLSGETAISDTTESQTKETTDNNLIEEQTDINNYYSESAGNNEEEDSMKLYINGTKVPVTWVKNDSVFEIMEEASKGDIIISMSMYNDFEQVGSLGKEYKKNDKQTTTHNGDIVLYNGSNLVLFYGSNSWSYTRLGKIDLSQTKVTELLSNKNVSVRITASTEN